MHIPIATGHHRNATDQDSEGIGCRHDGKLPSLIGSGGSDISTSLWGSVAIMSTLVALCVAFSVWGR